ncbi:MAG TPA: CarD family transcriptional regulator [Gaiellaceae bacterium]|nr:CarD family transcriptional regulator [Gaiellaceae bacterium]
MKLAVGEIVVYGAHGAGPITAREIRSVGGEEHVAIVLALADGLSVELPLERAEELLRPLADAEEIDRLRVVLRSDAAPDPDPWLKRQRAARAKLGTATGLAEILSAGAQRGSLSPGERDLVRRAQSLLADEIALSRGEDTSTASAWIDEQLARR